VIHPAQLAKIEQLVSEARPALGVLCDAEGRFGFFLIEQPVQDCDRNAANDGLEFVGAIGLVGVYVPRVALAIELDDAAISRLAAGFTALYARIIDRVERDMGPVFWLETLHKLPDARTETP
jgi:hypothetical protein